MSIPRFEFAGLSEYIRWTGTNYDSQSRSQKRVTSLKEYFKRIGKVLRAERPGRRCWDCWMKDCYWRHGGFTRWVEEGGYICEIVVERFKCKFCGATVSVVPCFVVPQRQYTLKQMAEGIESYATTPTTYRDEVKRMGAVEQRSEKLPGSSVSQLFLWVGLLAKRAEELLLDLQRLCVAGSVAEEDLEEAENAKCPNAWKAQIPGKGNKLNALAKVVSYGKLLFKGAESAVLEPLGMLFLKNVEGMQRIFANERLRMPTPHKTRPRIL